MYLTLDMAITDFNRGLLLDAKVQSAKDQKGYVISITSSLSVDGTRLLHCTARKKEPRVFKSVDGALNTLKTIGFTNFSIGAQK